MQIANKTANTRQFNTNTTNHRADIQKRNKYMINIAPCCINYINVGEYVSHWNITL